MLPLHKLACHTCGPFIENQCTLHTFFSGGCHNGAFQNANHETKSRKYISIDGLSEFQWNEIEAKVEIGSGSFGVAYKADFNKNTVVVKRL